MGEEIGNRNNTKEEKIPELILNIRCMSVASFMDGSLFINKFKYTIHPIHYILTKQFCNDQLKKA